MSIVKNYSGRTFKDNEYFKPRQRLIAGISSNLVWLYTVERGTELERDTGKQSEKTLIRIVRWRARNDKNKNKKIWQYHRSYNVRSLNEWENTSDLVNVLIGSEAEDRKFRSISVEEYDSLHAAAYNLKFEKSEKRILLSKIHDLQNVSSAAEAESNSYKKRLSLMRSNVKKLRLILSKFNKLISQPYTTETDVHKFLYDNKAFWMFGLEYISLKKKVRFPPGKNYYEFDLMLQRHDSFWDLVELKGPNESLFDKRTTRRSTPNRKLSEAVGQVFKYLFEIDRMGERNIIKPKAYIVIGKHEIDQPSERRIFSSYLNNVDLITYSELYERGQQLLKHLSDNFPEVKQLSKQARMKRDLL